MNHDGGHVHYLSHPEVVIDPAKPVPEWGLSPIGRARAERAARAQWLRNTASIISSAERKAIETAEIIAAHLRLDFEIRPDMHENDRSSTGCLPQTEFKSVADQFFAEPNASVRGWERAIDAQARIVREVETVLKRDQPGDILFVGHGGVGTLLICHYSKVPISRAFDQTSGGNYFALNKDTREILHPWRPMEESSVQPLSQP
jgi:broad specificity phosphatase PhoE